MLKLYKSIFRASASFFMGPVFQTSKFSCYETKFSFNPSIFRCISNVSIYDRGEPFNLTLCLNMSTQSHSKKLQAAADLMRSRPPATNSPSYLPLNFRSF